MKSQAHAQPLPLTLAFSGGGAKCAAQAGVLAVLEEARLPVGAMVGLSGGGLVALLYAAGLSPQAIRDYIANTSLLEVWELDPARRSLFGETKIRARWRRWRRRPGSGWPRRWDKSGQVERAADGEATSVKDVRVDHGRLHIRVAEEFLHSPDIIPGFEEVGGERVAERMAGGVFGNAGSAHSLFEGPLQARGVYVVAAHEVGARVPGKRSGRKDELPSPFFAGIGVFALQGKRQIDGVAAFVQVFLMQLFDAKQMSLQKRVELVGEHRHAIFHAFAVADDDLALFKVQIFDAQADAFHDAQPAAIEQLRHELVFARQLTQKGLDFGLGEHDRKVMRLFGADEVNAAFDVFLENSAIEKEEGAEGLALRAGRDPALDGEVGQKPGNLWFAHRLRMALVVEKNIALDPIQVGLFGAIGIVPQGDATRCLRRRASRIWSRSFFGGGFSLISSLRACIRTTLGI